MDLLDWYERDCKKQVQIYKKILRDDPNMPASMKKKIMLWMKVYQGDENAIMKLSFMKGLITAEQYANFRELGREWGE